MEREKAVEFSARYIELINYYNVERHDTQRDLEVFQQRNTYYVQNKCNSCRKLRVALGESSHPAYELLRGTEEHYLAAGLKLPVVLQYSPTDAEFHLGEIIVHVDDEPTIAVPIRSILPMPCLEVCPSVIDFGDLVCEHQITSQQLTLTNTGSKQGNFVFLVDQLPRVFKVSPTKVTLSPGKTVHVKVELLCKKEESFSEHLRITTDDDAMTSISVILRGAVIIPQLRLLDTSDSSCHLERVAFGDVYYGTAVSRKVLLFNDSPVFTQYLAVLNTNAEGAVDGMDANEKLATIWSKSLEICKDQSNAQSGQTLLQVVPMQGSLDPYEKRMLKMIFSPQFESSCLGWTRYQSIPVHKDYALFVQFLRIGTSSINVSLDSTLEIAVTGTARPLQLTINPGTFLDFGPCTVGKIMTEKLLLYNASDVLPVNFQCCQVAHYKCLPTSGRINPGKELPLLISFQPKQVGPLNYKMCIDMMCPGRRKFKEAFHSIIIDLHGNGQHSFEMTRKGKLPTSLVIGASSNGRNLSPQAVARYTYIDPDYCYNSEEVKVRAAHRQSFVDCNRERQIQRQWKKKEKALFNPTFATKLDLNIPPAYGLTSPALSVVQSYEPPTLINQPPPSLSTAPKMLTFKDMDDLTSAPLDFIEYSSSKSVSFEVSSQCESHLSPLELSQISFEPEVLDFGSAIVDSVIEKTISIKNYSQKHICVRMELSNAQIYSKKFGSNPRFILTPQSFTEVVLSMQPGDSGTLERCVWYSINGHHKGHLPVKANVSQLTLSLSTLQLDLTEPAFASKSAGLRGSVLISNRSSVVASYQWHATEGVDPDVFSATHSTGVIPAGSSLECEFVCLPSYDCPSAAQFSLAVAGRDSAPTTAADNHLLILLPKFTKPTCEFREKRLLLGMLPLNLTTIRTLHIENKGNCHAYFKIRDASPHSGIVVSCKSGCVPVGGNVKLRVIIKPEIIELFDVKLIVDLKGGNSICLRITGTVEYPSISISEDTFRFGGVYCGARATIPFTVSNKGLVKVQLVFDLTYLSEFSLIGPVMPGSYGEGIQANDPAKGVFLVNLPGKTDAQCLLQFCPLTVASYDYQLPLLVNGMRAANCPPSSSWPPSNACSTITLHPTMPMPGKIPSCRVLATVMTSPLLVSNTVLNFSIHPGFLDEIHAPIEHQEVIKLRNVSDHPLSWALDYSTSPRLDDKTFQFCVPSGTSATNEFPTLVSAAHLQPGEEFIFTAVCQPPHHGTFDDMVSLILNGDVIRPYRNIELRASLPAGTFSINPGHVVVQPVPLRVSVIAKFTVCAEYFTSPVELSVSLPTVDSEVNLVVTFPEDSTIYNIDHSKKTEISCQLEFSSTKPISKSDYIIIADKSSDIRKRICFTVVADNDLFTLYTLLANSTPQSTTRGDNYLPSQSLQPRHETSGSHLNLAFNSPPFNDILTYTCDDYTAYTSIQDSVRGICRWLSAYGWSNGVKSISSPLDFRIRVGEDLPRTGVKQRSNIGTSRGLLLDLLTHLCGRVPPGIPLNLPPSTIASERINQLYSTYDSVISFLRNQGGLMWIVVPEALLDYHDYQQWVQDVAMNRNISFNPQNEVQFNILSQQAWTHLLMQIIKVLVLPRVIKHVPKYLEDKVCSTNADTCSIPERVLLAWLNHHYQNQQKGILRRRDFGIKQITNYDSDLMDSTVLACVLASYCPFLIEMYFEDLYEHPCHPEQCTHNAIIFIRALKHIGIDYDILPSDICSPNAISMILFILHLYERMFSFKPKETLIFEAVLGEAINQQMQLENSTSKQIEYHILIRGEDASDFHLTNGNTTITLAGHQSGQLYLTFHGHTLNPSSATLLILARGNKSAASSVQAFRLSGYVSKAKPQFSTTLTASLYELQLISLTVTNPYPKSGFFDMCISESSDEGSLLSAEMCMISTSSLQKRSDDQMHMFELANQDKIFLEPGYTISLILKFVPLKLMPRHCAITLKNKKLGDIVLSVYATVSLPKPSIPESRYINSSTVVNSQTRTLHLKAHTGQTIEEEIIISTNNVALDNALLEISKWSMTQTEIKQRIVSESFKHVILSTAKVVLQGRDDELQNHQLEDQEKIVYSIDGSDNKHFCFPGEVCLLANNKDVATVPVKFHAEFEGQYECHLVLKSMYDVRVVIVESTVFSTDKHIELEFNTKALLPLTQNIPLINPSTVDWPFVATVNATSFQGPKFITAQSLTTTPYPLTFSPHREGFVEGDLQLTNSTDKTEYVFHLKGVAERPIAQECIKLCVQAKTSVTHVLRVHNYHERTLVFQVESDLDFISGPSSITIGGHDVVDYPLLIVPKQQGIFTGAIAFVAQAMSRPHSFSESLEATLDSSPSFHIWFQVECTVNAAPPDRVVIVSCPVLSSSVVQLSVVNPHSYPLILQVSLEGHGLSGPDHMEISPEGEASYPLTFTPTLVGQTKGRVVFNCVTNGEFWYQLDLFADNPKSTSISPISCELGKTCMLAISLTNPLDIPVRFNCNNTNTKHFIVTGLAEGQVTVEPQTSEDIHILFKPSAIGAADHAAKLVFISKQFGRHLFLLQGNGISPQEMDPINIVANLGSNSVHVINFTNPLDTAMHFSISVKGEDSEHFCLLMRHIHSIVLHPGVSLDIPIMFAPEVMRGHKANILIISDGEDSKHCWSYPVFGQPELRAHSNLLNIICRAKERFQQKFQVSLMSMLGKYDTTSIKSIAAHTEGASTEAPYSYKLIYCDNSLVEKCTGIQLTSKRVASAYSDAANTTILEFVLVFTPPKAFKCSCELYISGREGAAWIFPLRLIATPAAPDDVIIVEAAGLNTEAQVCLRLTSLTEHAGMDGGCGA